MSEPDLGSIDAMVLAGGLGTRLRSVVPDRPKCLAEIRGRPFLSYFLEQLTQQRVRHTVLCTGHLGEMVAEAIGARHGPMRISYSREAAPLGTAGALRLALSQTSSDPVLAMNGDSFCDIDLAAFLAFHRISRAKASIVLTQVEDASRYAQVRFDDHGRVTRFDEKVPSAGPGWISAGIYLLSRDLIEQIPADRSVSIEREAFPEWIGGGLYAWPGGGRFIDIGTPQSYLDAQSFLDQQ
jgi:NDP-sugar pyrophosphorylase family protein